jgi:DNA-binding NtrC family response regulator
LKRFAAETKKIFLGVRKETERHLLGYEWPGNVRELANVIERAVVPAGDRKSGCRISLLGSVSTESSASPDGMSYRHNLDVARAEVIRRALASTQGNRAAAARLLGLHKSHLLNLMKSLRIE